MHVQFDQKPSKMLNMCRLKKAAANSWLCAVFKHQARYLGAGFIKNTGIGLI